MFESPRLSGKIYIANCDHRLNSCISIAKSSTCNFFYWSRSTPIEQMAIRVLGLKPSCVRRLRRSLAPQREKKPFVRGAAHQLRTSASRHHSNASLRGISTTTRTRTKVAIMRHKARTTAKTETRTNRPWEVLRWQCRLCDDRQRAHVDRNWPGARRD